MINNLSKYLSLESHDQKIDNWHYESLFSDDQKSIKEDIIVDIILEKKLLEEHSFSNRMISYLGQALTLSVRDNVKGEHFYFCTIMKGEHGNFDVQLINQLSTSEINEELSKASIRHLLDDENAGFMEHEIERWVSFLSSTLDTMICASIKKSTHNVEMQFEIEHFKI